MTIKTPKYFTFENFRVSGIYFLIKGSRIVYIGQSKTVLWRIEQSVRGKEYDTIRFIFCPISKLKHYEKRWIMKFRPKYNTMHLYKFLGGWFTNREKLPINQEKYIGRKKLYLKKVA